MEKKRNVNSTKSNPMVCATKPFVERAEWKTHLARENAVPLYSILTKCCCETLVCIMNLLDNVDDQRIE